VKRLRGSSLGVVALASVLTLVMAGAAYAASNHGISGTVYSGCSGKGPWYISTIARTKEGTGLIKAKFTDINEGGLTFRLLDGSNAQIGVTQSWSKNETNIWRTFATSVRNGRTFYNSFRDTVYECPSGQTNYNFTGTEYY
jgi:hypothetical protein